MKYKTMSIYELNKAVALALGLTLSEDDKQKPQTGIILTESTYMLKGIEERTSYKAYDFCQLMDQAWPIIEDNHISLECCYHDFDGETEHYKWEATSQEHERYLCSNPSKAAMIVYLMMQENKDEG